MSKLKIILCTISIFIISAVGCFADEVKIGSKSGEYSYSVWFEHRDRDGFWIVDSVEEPKFNNGNIMISGKCILYTSNSDGTVKTKKSELSSFNSYYHSYKILSSGGGSVVPPVIAPTVEEALTEIVPRFLEQLKNYLPTCILILSMLLGVSLVPRIIHLLM